MRMAMQRVKATTWKERRETDELPRLGRMG